MDWSHWCSIFVLSLTAVQILCVFILTLNNNNKKPTTGHIRLRFQSRLNSVPQFFCLIFPSVYHGDRGAHTASLPLACETLPPPDITNIDSIFIVKYYLKIHLFRQTNTWLPPLLLMDCSACVGWFIGMSDTPQEPWAEVPFELQELAAEWTLTSCSVHWRTGDVIIVWKCCLTEFCIKWDLWNSLARGCW